MDVQMADVQCDQESLADVLPTMSRFRWCPPPSPPHRLHMDVEAGQLVQIDMATPRDSPLEWQGNVEAPDPTAAVSWSEEQLLELATSRPAL